MIFQILKYFWLSLLSLAIIVLTISTSINAQQVELTEYNLKIIVNDDDSASFGIQRSITNKDELYLVEGYEFVFPANVPETFKATLGGERIDHEIVGAFQNYAKINLPFVNVIKQNETRLLQIDAKVNNFVKSIGEMKYISIYSSGDGKANLDIEFPTSFGKPSLITAEGYLLEESGNNYRLKLQQPDSLLLLWPGEYDVNIQSTFQLENFKDSEVSQLISLFYEDAEQKVYYKNKVGGKYGLVDNVGNRLARMDLLSGEVKVVEIEASIRKSGSVSSNRNYLPSLGWPGQSQVVQDINNATLQTDDIQEKFIFAFDYLKTQKKMSESDDVNFDMITTHWEYLGNATEYTSFDYCFVMSAFAQSIGLDAQMEYGYELIASESFPTKLPIFWCQIFLPDGTGLQFDFSTYFTYGFDLRDLSPDHTKLRVGYWSPEHKYIDPLGLLQKDGFVQTLEFLDDETYKVVSNQISIVPAQSINATSGFYHMLPVDIVNQTGIFTPLTNFKFDGIVYNQNLSLNENFRFALLPNQINTIPFREVRTESFLFDGTVTLMLELEVENEFEENIKTTVTIDYEVNKEMILLFISIISIGLAIVLVAIWRTFMIRKPQRQEWGNSMY